MTASNHFTDLARTYVVAEIGVNHNGDVSLARDLVHAAKQVGADAVKFQTFTASTLVTPGTPKVAYQETTTSPDESHYEMIERLELSRSAHQELFDLCGGLKIDFISTPYDVDSARFLYELGVKYFKTASADIVDIYLHEYLASTGTPTMIATGMATESEIAEVAKVYADADHPDLVFLHCVSNYPCSDEALNLKAMVETGERSALPIGYSDLSDGYTAAISAVALGAVVVEKHFTLDRSLEGPDHKASSEPENFRELVDNIRRVEMMLGELKKRCQEEERQMASVARKSLVASRYLSKGTTISMADLTARRPGSGILPSERSRVIGSVLNTDIEALELISWSQLQRPE